MADKNKKKVERFLVAPDVKERWGLIDKEDYPLIMAEYTLQMRDYSKQTNEAVNSIKGWVTFVGILLILQIVVLIFF